MAATPAQIQTITNALQQQIPDLTPADADRLAQTLTSSAVSPQDKFNTFESIAKQYPGFKMEGFFKNPAVKAALIGTGALVGASYLVPLLTGAAPAITPTVSGAAGPLAADETFAAGPVAGAGLAGVDTAGMVAPAVSTGFGAALKSALPSIIGASASLGGSAIAAHGQTSAANTQAAAAEKAAQIQADQLDRALAQAKYIWQTQRADQSGYRSSGNNAVGALDFGLGLPAPTFDKPPEDPSIANPAPSTGVAPGAVDANGKPLPGAATAPYVTPPTDVQQRTNASPLGSGGGGLVPVRSPDGLVKLIPQTQVASALQAGGTQV